LKDVVFGIGVT